MAKTKQKEEAIAKAQLPPMPIIKYKPVPKFKSGCKNC